VWYGRDGPNPNDLAHAFDGYCVGGRIDLEGQQLAEILLLLIAIFSRPSGAREVVPRL
jgi:hypothetical protein